MRNVIDKILPKICNIFICCDTGRNTKLRWLKLQYFGKNRNLKVGASPPQKQKWGNDSSGINTVFHPVEVGCIVNETLGSVRFTFYLKH